MIRKLSGSACYGVSEEQVCVQHPKTSVQSMGMYPSRKAPECGSEEQVRLQEGLMARQIAGRLSIIGTYQPHNGPGRFEASTPEQYYSRDRS
jgi:hypothetical protein